MFSQLKEIVLAIVRNRALAIVVLTFTVIISVIIVNISFNRQITKDFTSKVEDTDRLYKTQNLIAQLERKLAESDRTRRQLSTRFKNRIEDYQKQNQQVAVLGSNLFNPDSSSLSRERQNELVLLLGKRKQLVQSQLQYYQSNKALPESLFEQGQDNLIELTAFTDLVRKELSQSLENNIRYLRKKIDISDQVNILLVITALIASVFATTLTTQDFLRQKQIESILRTLNDEKSKLFSILGHDLRSPISGLNGIIYILKNHRKEMSEEELDDAVGQLELTSQNYIKLLEDVLTWSRLQLNKVPIEFQDLNLHLIVKDTSDLYGEQVHKKKIWIHNQVPAGLLIRSDKGMLQVVLRNLISNAIKFTSEGGDIWINYRSDKEFHYLDVKDTGVGMSDAILRTLFTNSTISMAGTNNESGTGLGLSICKEFLSKDDGSLRVESIPGKGSVFTVALPLPETRKRLQKERKKSYINGTS